MPKSCAAFGCTNNSNKQICKEKRVSFYAFPLNRSTVLTEWLVKFKRQDFTPSEYSVLCSEHFTEDDFTYQN